MPVQLGAELATGRSSYFSVPRIAIKAMRGTNMENFDWTRFTRRIAVRAKLSDVYRAWTSSRAIEQWFLSRAINRDADQQDLDPDTAVSEGCSYEWRWYGYDGVEHGRITKANGVDHLQFTFAGECPVDVRMREDGERVIVELTQSNIPEDEKSKRDIRLGCDSGWSFYLVNLKSVLEGGLDLRNKDAALKGMVNS